MQWETKQRCAFWIWYRGDSFRGFQSQAGGGTVQQTFEEALARIGAGQRIFASGRTDLGVHARMQVLSLRLPRGMTPEALAAELSPHLPTGALGIASARAASAKFHAAWLAAGKEYRYRFALGAKVPDDWKPLAWSVATHPRLAGSVVAPERLESALGKLVGARDFYAFHEKSSARKIRNLRRATLHALGGDLYEARFSGDGFAKYQVRYLAGAAALVAAGVVGSEEYERALDSGAPLHGLKAPAEGLTLWEVCFPEELDPFPPALRAEAPGVPELPPFVSPTAGGDPRTSPGGR